MGDEIEKTLGKYLEPGRAELTIYPIASGVSWATLKYDIDDFSVKPVLYSHLSQLAGEYTVEAIDIQMGSWTSDDLHIDRLCVAINKDTYAWADDDPYFEHGNISIVGNTRTVQVMAANIHADPVSYLRPKKTDILAPKIGGLSKVEVNFRRYNLEREPFRQTLQKLASNRPFSFFVPLEQWNGKFFYEGYAVIDQSIFITANQGQCTLIGPQERVSKVASTVSEAFDGEITA